MPELEGGLDERTVFDRGGGDVGRASARSSWGGMDTEEVEDRHLAVGRCRGEGGGDDVRDACRA